jgi:hypothetical protein
MAEMKRPTRGWLLTRGLMAAGITAVGLTVILALGMWPDASYMGPMVMTPPDPFPAVLVRLACLGAALGGLWRMWLVMRGPREEAAGWRFLEPLD